MRSTGDTIAVGLVQSNPFTVAGTSVSKTGTGTSNALIVRFSTTGTVKFCESYTSSGCFMFVLYIYIQRACLILSSSSSNAAPPASAVQQFGGTGDAAGFSVDFDQVSGDYAVFGTLTSTINFNGTSLTSAGSRDVFRASYNSNGKRSLLSSSPP